MNKSKIGIIALLTISLLSFSFFIFCHDARADGASILVYHLVTADSTPVIRGTVSDASASVFVAVGGHATQEATVSGDGSWSLEFSEELASGVHTLGVAATIGGATVSDSAYIYISGEYPLELYYEESDESFTTSLILFPEYYAYSSGDGNFSITFPAGTEITKTEGGDFDLSEWYAGNIDFNNERILLELRLGVPNVDLSFSEDITITFNVGEEYEGQDLHVFSRSEVGDDGWDPMDVSCHVESGSCSFNTSHASYFAVSQSTSIAETEQDSFGDGENSSEIDKVKARKYLSKNGKEKVRLVIYGKNFNKHAKVKLGSKKASKTKWENSKKLVGYFYMKELENLGHKKLTAKVIDSNGDTDEYDHKVRIGDLKALKLHKYEKIYKDEKYLQVMKLILNNFNFFRLR